MNRSTMKNLLEEISHGRSFEDLVALQRAITDGNCNPDIICSRCLMNEWMTVDNLRNVRAQVIVAILSLFEKQRTLSYGRKMPADHYARFFHALAILQVPKGDVDVDGNDHLFSAFYQLWLQDDGSKGAWLRIEAISWPISEAMKKFKRKRR